MKNVTCPVCQQKSERYLPKFELTRDKIQYAVLECPFCQHHYTFFDQEISISAYYDAQDYQVRDTRKSIFYTIQEKEYLPVIRNIKKLVRKKSISVLDFGAGKGLFLHLAKNNGLEGKGVETSLPRAKYAQSYFNIDIHTSEYSEGQIFDQRFDVITLFHVLEHIAHPFELLKNLSKDNLSTKGLLIIEVPNFDGWQAKWSGSNWLHLDLPRHLSHFSPEILEQQCSELGFSVLKKEHFSWHLGVIGMIQTIWSWFGYRGFLIGDLKKGKNLSMLLKIAFTLPFAILLEALAALCNRGGIMRYYLQQHTA